jgi:hypothetical protein
MPRAQRLQTLRQHRYGFDDTMIDSGHKAVSTRGWGRSTRLLAAKPGTSLEVSNVRPSRRAGVVLAYVNVLDAVVRSLGSAGG